MRVTAVVHTIGHGRRPVEELIECLRGADVETLVDVRRFPSSRRNPQFTQAALAGALECTGISYLHAVELGGLRGREPGEELFACLGRFAGYAARMRAQPYWGGGIMRTVRLTRACAEDELVEIGRRRLHSFLRHGITSMEAKTGFALTPEGEEMLLRATARLAEESDQRVSRCPAVNQGTMRIAGPIGCGLTQRPVPAHRTI